MKVVITGASGLLGRAFIRHYGAELELVALYRGQLGTDTVASEQDLAQWVACDFSEEELTSVFKGADGILHLAATRPLKKGKERAAAATNHALDAKVFRAAQKAEARNIVFSSSRGVYGDALPPWQESQKLAPQTAYAKAKRTSEELAESLNREGMRIKALRLAQLLSADEYAGGMLNTFFANALASQPLHVSVCGIKREYLYVKDAVSALLAALQQPEISGVFNLGSGTVTGIEELARTIADAVQQPELVVVDEPLTKIEEYSLMDSRQFYEEFAWRPSYSLDSAVKDIIVAKRSRERS